MTTPCKYCRYTFNRCYETWTPYKCWSCPRGGKNPGDPHCLCVTQPRNKMCKYFKLEWRFWKWIRE